MISILYKEKHKVYFKAEVSKVWDALENINLISGDIKFKEGSDNAFRLQKSSNSTKPDGYGYLISGRLISNSYGTTMLLTYRVERLYLVYICAVFPLYLLSVLRFKIDALEMVIGYFLLGLLVDVLIHIIQKRVSKKDFDELKRLLSAIV